MSFCKIKENKIECSIILRSSVKKEIKKTTLKCAICKLNPCLGDKSHISEFGDVFPDAYFKNKDGKRIFICEHCRESL